jgi:hypothetical protein
MIKMLMIEIREFVTRGVTISRLSKCTTSRRTHISTKTSIYTLARHHLNKSNKDSRHVLC